MDKQLERYVKHSYDKLLFHEYKKNPETAQQLKDIMKSEVFCALLKDWNHFQTNVKPGTLSDLCSKSSKSRNDISLYAGSGSYLYLYLRMYEFVKSLNFLQKQKFKDIGSQVSIYFNKYFKSDENYHQFYDPRYYLELARVQFTKMENSLSSQFEQHNISYYMSSFTIWLLGAKLSYYLNDPNKFMEVTNIIGQITPLIIKNKEKVYYEVLYGVPGMIYILLDLQNFVENMTNEKRDTFRLNFDIRQHILQLCYLTVDQGLKFYGLELDKIDLKQVILPQDFRLKYFFHEREYLGGAHGLLGVIQIILIAYTKNQATFFDKKSQILTQIMLHLIRESLNTVLCLQLSSGNFPSSFNKKERDVLVQFCHGAPGAVQPLFMAYQIFDDKKYLESALKAIQCIWHQGLITKGMGLCHGIPGNAYPFLTAYKITNDLIYYQYAWKFLLYKQDSDVYQKIKNYDFGDRYKVGVSDNPYSLMLGISGDICAEIEFILEGDRGFPGYEL